MTVLLCSVIFWIKLYCAAFRHRKPSGNHRGVIMIPALIFSPKNVTTVCRSASEIVSDGALNSTHLLTECQSIRTAAEADFPWWWSVCRGSRCAGSWWCADRRVSSASWQGTDCCRRDDAARTQSEFPCTRLERSPHCVSQPGLRDLTTHTWWQGKYVRITNNKPHTKSS